MKRPHPPLKDIMRITGLSRATVDRVLNKRGGVHESTQQQVDAAIQKLVSGEVSVTRPGQQKEFKLIIQADDEFIQAVTNASIILAPESDKLGYSLQIIPCQGQDDEAVALIIAEQESSDGVAILAKNVFPIIRAASALRQKDVPVVAMNTDLDVAARHAFVGIDNRAAGQTAGFLMGRHLGRLEGANVAVVVQTMSYRCHEEREMGFRAILRQRFPSLNLIDIVTLDNSSSSAYEATKELLARWPTIDGIYNTAGGNLGLAQALDESGLKGRTLFVAHEFHAVTEPLIRNDAIDYLITQNMRALLMGTMRELTNIANGDTYALSTLITPDLLCRYSLPYAFV